MARKLSTHLARQVVRMYSEHVYLYRITFIPAILSETELNVLPTTHATLFNKIDLKFFGF